MQYRKGNGVKKFTIKGILATNDNFYTEGDPDEYECFIWLLKDRETILWSNEIGDEIGVLKIEEVAPYD